MITVVELIRQRLHLRKLILERSYVGYRLYLVLKMNKFLTDTDGRLIQENVIPLSEDEPTLSYVRTYHSSGWIDQDKTEYDADDPRYKQEYRRLVTLNSRGQIVETLILKKLAFEPST